MHNSDRISDGKRNQFLLSICLVFVPFRLVFSFNVHMIKSWYPGSHTQLVLIRQMSRRWLQVLSLSLSMSSHITGKRTESSWLHKWYFVCWILEWFSVSRRSFCPIAHNAWNYLSVSVQNNVYIRRNKAFHAGHFSFRAEIQPGMPIPYLLPTRCDTLQIFDYRLWVAD